MLDILEEQYTAITDINCAFTNIIDCTLKNKIDCALTREIAR